MIKPGTKAPELEVKTVGGGEWKLYEQNPKKFTFVFFYRGYHCPICQRQLSSVNQNIDDLTKLGVEVVAVSTDSEERATKSKEEWGLDKLTIGYGMPVEEGRNWGLYVSNPIKENEPKPFTEPGLFVIRPDGELFASSVQTMPFTRPNIEELIKGFTYIVENDYPGRGEA